MEESIAGVDSPSSSSTSSSSLIWTLSPYPSPCLDPNEMISNQDRFGYFQPSPIIANSSTNHHLPPLVVSPPLINNLLTPPSSVEKFSTYFTSSLNIESNIQMTGQTPLNMFETSAKRTSLVLSQPTLSSMTPSSPSSMMIMSKPTPFYSPLITPEHQRNFFTLIDSQPELNENWPADFSQAANATGLSPEPSSQEEKPSAINKSQTTETEQNSNRTLLKHHHRNNNNRLSFKSSYAHQHEQLNKKTDERIVSAHLPHRRRKLHDNLMKDSHHHHQSTSNNHKSQQPQTCRVCGDGASGRNFGVVTCGSCKIFFRRNIGTKDRLKCRNNNQCMQSISKLTRRNCSACRLDKCFRLGMKIKQSKKDRFLLSMANQTSPSNSHQHEKRHQSVITMVNEDSEKDEENFKDEDDEDEKMMTETYKDLPTLISIEKSLNQFKSRLPRPLATDQMVEKFKTEIVHNTNHNQYHNQCLPVILPNKCRPSVINSTTVSIVDLVNRIPVADIDNNDLNIGVANNHQSLNDRIKPSISMPLFQNVSVIQQAPPSNASISVVEEIDDQEKNLETFFEPQLNYGRKRPKIIDEDNEDYDEGYEKSLETESAKSTTDSEKKIASAFNKEEDETCFDQQREVFNYSNVLGQTFRSIEDETQSSYDYNRFYDEHYYRYYSGTNDGGHHCHQKSYTDSTGENFWNFNNCFGSDGSCSGASTSSNSVELCKIEAKNFADLDQALIAELDKWTPFIRIKLGLDFDAEGKFVHQLFTKEKEKIQTMNLSCRMISAKPHSNRQLCAIFDSLERGIFHANKSFGLYEDFWCQNNEINELIRQNETGFNRKKNKLLHQLYHLRGVQNYDETLNAWAIFNGLNANTFTMIKLDMFQQSVKKEMSTAHHQYITSFPKEWRLDPTIFNLMTYLLLFGAFDQLHSHFKCEKLRYFKYLYLFKRYFECMYNDDGTALQMLLWVLKLIRRLTPLCSECLTACTHSLNPQLLQRIGPSYAQCLMEQNIDTNQTRTSKKSVISDQIENDRGDGGDIDIDSGQTITSDTKK